MYKNYKDTVDIFVEVCREGAILPSYAKPGDAGMDVCAAEDTIIGPGETQIVPTGLKMSIPQGFEIQVRPRSGISFKTPLRISNSPGTIDSGYRDEVGVIITNTSSISCNSENQILTLDSKDNKMGTYKINKGDRIAQIVLHAVPRMAFKIVDSISVTGNDRGGGFGSTGIK